jgi:glucuronate isomerase
MLNDRLAQELYNEISRIALIDAHSHIDPLQPTARSLDEILNYHYYTELAHSSGMDVSAVGGDVDPRERVRSVLYHMSRFDNTAQYMWFVEIARAFLNFQGHRISLADSSTLCDAAERLMARPDWEERVLRQTNLEKVILTNDFDDPLDGFDRQRYIPCLRADALLFRCWTADVAGRIGALTGVEPSDAAALRRAIGALVERFVAADARACAVSLPPDFVPAAVDDRLLSQALAGLRREEDASAAAAVARAAFGMLVEQCADRRLPLCLMVGVNRGVYEHGVAQGGDLFDGRSSLLPFARVFNDYPGVTFCVSVLSSAQNQELASYAWIFPNVIASGHWWYSNIPALIERDARVRLQAVPKTKQIGYYSDMYKLEFGLPKFNMYRRILAQLLADDFVRPHLYSEAQAVELARLLLRDNAQRLFNL